MAFVKTEGSIALMIQECDGAFKKLLKALKENAHGHQKDLERCSDEIGRFNGWERDVDGRSGNLDYKLRRSLQLHEGVIKLLSDLRDAFKSVSSNLSSRSPSPSIPSDLFADDSESDTDSLQSLSSQPRSSVGQMLSEITEIVTCLLQLRPALDDPVPHDQISRTFDASAAEFDIKHIKEKLPRASKELADRLGRANWKRRHYLIGLQSLRQPETSSYGGPLRQPTFVKELRPSREPSDKESSDGEGASSSEEAHSNYSGEDGQSSVEWSRNSKSSSALASTNPTTMFSVKDEASKKPPVKAVPLTGHLPLGQVTNIGPSQTPAPAGPNMLSTGKPFRCSYCGLEVTNYKRGRKWRKHVTRDIEPYVCTFEGCKWPDKTYGSKRDWLQHEYNAHRTEKSWKCQACEKTYKDLGQFKSHLKEVHDLLNESEQLWTIIDACEVSSPITEQRTQCPFCRTDHKTPQRLQKHLAEHLEELAQFVTISAGGQDDEHHDLDLVEDSSVESNDVTQSIIESIPRSNISLQKAQRMNVEKYFDVMSQFSMEVPLEDSRQYRESLALAKVESEIQFPIFAVLHTPNEFFYGRDADLRTINSSFSKAGQICSITGIGGVGKTELAVQYVHQFKKEFDCIFWIQADTDPGIIESFCQIAISLELLKGTEEQNQVIEVGREWLMNTEKRWLLVFDNIEIWDYLEQYLPRRYSESTVGNVLLTTQIRGIVDRSSASVDLTPFEDEQGAKMLLHYMERKEPYDEDELNQARDISNLLGGLPVAVCHVSGYVLQSECDLDELLEIFKERRRVMGVATLEQDDLPAAFRKATFSFEETLAIVWNITLRELPKDSQDLIYILAYLNSEAVPEALLHRVHQEPLLQFLDSRESRRYNKMRRQLLTRRLLLIKKVDNEPCLSIHRSLQRNIRQTVSQDPLKAQEVFKQAFTVIRQEFPEPSPIQVPNGNKDWLAYQRLLPHVYALRNAYVEAKGKLLGTRDFVELLSHAGINQWERGITRDGLLLLRAAEEVLSQLKFDDADLQKSNINTTIALMSDNTGISQRADGRERRQEVLEVRLKHFKPLSRASRASRNDEILLYNSYMDYSISLLQYNRYKDAKPIIESCFERYQEWGSEDELPYEYSKYHHWIGIVHMYEGNFEEAIRHGELGVALMARTDNDSLENRFKFDLACIVLQSGDDERALKLHREVHEAREQTSGRVSELTLHSCYAIGAIYELRGFHERAEVWFSRAMDHRRSAYWSKEAIARTQFHLSQTLKAQNKTLDKMQKLYDEAKAVLDHLLPLDYPEHLKDVDDEGILFDHLLTVCAARFTGTGLLKLLGEQAD